MPAKLRVIPGVGHEDDFGLQPSGFCGGSDASGSNLGDPVLRRPGDHVETLWLRDPSVLTDLRAAIGRRRLHPDTGLAIVLERRLAIGALRSSALVAMLDDLSSVEVPEIELWSAHSAYLSHLLHGFADLANSGGSGSNSSLRVSVPIRLVDRLTNALPASFERADDEVKNSIQWEVAALLHSETLSEWAYRSTLDRLSVAGS